jgi:TRAP-type C4-dicarboxylate transport system substrate-binding protein
MTRTLRLSTLTAAVALAALTGTASAESLEIRMATLAPAGSKWMEGLDKAAAEIKDKTAGRVTIKMFDSGSQGDEKDFIRKIKAGGLDAAAVTAVGLAMIDESIRVLELPMLFQDADEMDYVADKMWPYFQKKFEKKGFKLNDRGEVGWVYFISKNKVDSLESLKAQKIWMWGDDQLVGALFRKLGVNGVPLGVPEVDAALTAGRINAAYGSPIAAVALQWYTKIKFMTSMPMSFAIGATVVSLDAMKKASEEDQKTVIKVSKTAGKKLRKAIRKENENAKKVMVSKGVKVTETPVEMVDAFRKDAEAIWKDLVGKVYSQEELDMVLKYRDEFRAKKTK